MKIIIKTLSGQVFNIDVEGTDTVCDSIHPLDSQH